MFITAQEQLFFGIEVTAWEISRVSDIAKLFQIPERTNKHVGDVESLCIDGNDQKQRAVQMKESAEKKRGDDEYQVTKQEMLRSGSLTFGKRGYDLG